MSTEQGRTGLSAGDGSLDTDAHQLGHINPAPVSRSRGRQPYVNLSHRAAIETRAALLWLVVRNGKLTARGN